MMTAPGYGSLKARALRTLSGPQNLLGFGIGSPPNFMDGKQVLA